MVGISLVSLNSTTPEQTIQIESRNVIWKPSTGSQQLKTIHHAFQEPTFLGAWKIYQEI
jgi:hypothetical protein